MKKGKLKKLVCFGVVLTMLTLLAAGCGEKEKETNAETEKAGVDEGVTISLLNTKSELEDSFGELTQKYKEQTGVNIDVQFTNDVVSTHLSEKYDSGSPYTIMMLDRSDVYEFGEYFKDLSDQKWIADGGADYGVNIDGKTYSFPLLIESVGLLYNAQVIEDITGKTFEWTDYSSSDKFEALLQELADGGMKTPVAVNQDDWSLANHYFAQLYNQQENSEESSQAFVDKLKKGEVKLTDDKRFNSLLDSFDMLLKYNVNGADPLAADYDMNNEYFANGDVAFWFNGSWAMDVYNTTNQLGIMPLPQSDTDGQANERLIAGASKTLVIDQEYSTEEQQKAAEDFLNWLVYDEAGQEFLVEGCNIIPAFANIKKEVLTPISGSVQKFIKSGNTAYWYQAIPENHGTEIGASLQKYISKNTDRNGLAADVENYWSSQK